VNENMRYNINRKLIEPKDDKRSYGLWYIGYHPKFLDFFRFSPEAKPKR
jgi:hypothetical protein